METAQEKTDWLCDYLGVDRLVIRRANGITAVSIGIGERDYASEFPDQLIAAAPSPRTELMRIVKAMAERLKQEGQA